MVLILDRVITPEEFEKVREVYEDYIKVVVDIKREVICVGGEYHVDCEQELIENGSKQSDLYGGGYRISTKEIEYMAMSNFKPNLGRMTYEISDPRIRQIMTDLITRYLII